MFLLSKSGRTFLATGMLMATVTITSTVTAAESGSFEFRDARLGMTIEEFQALPALGSMRLFEYSSRGKKLGDGLLTKCAPSDDKVDAQIGVVECTRAGDGPFTPQPYKYIYTSIGYKFGPDASGTKRLFGILLITGRDNYSEAASGLRSKWGSGKIENSTVTNGLGHPLPKTTEIWTKPQGTIELESPCGNVTTICITYTDTGLITVLAAQRARISGGPATRF